MSLKGKTLFISGASRGIGKAMAMRAACDGANIAIAAKTAEPHPKLPGTIFTAAEEMEAAGGKALPCIVDVRSEEAVLAAVKKTVDTFGGVDILINNASAIILTGTLETPMKRFDLMHQINTRGTYLCSQACLPHLLKADNPHILNISPPLNMETRWFQNHTAYTMAKFGMSMCVLGMAGEFAGKVGVNALWPRTVIETAAVLNLLGGKTLASKGRTVEIMADAAYAVLNRDGKTCSGNFFIDDEVLTEEGVFDFERYKVTPGTADEDLAPDFFI
ncbi:MAG: NAD(P)-dependent oxidoreductase [Acidobacteriota bacterium]|nr:NAD(P)-dependent oxidoreductase [Acidobacteriota bacterium]